MNNEKQATAFWEDQKFYPSYQFIKERRKYEIDTLLNHIPIDTKSLLDLGCGNGSTTILLRELTHIKEYHCYDISEGMLSTIGGTRDSELIVEVFDANDSDYVLPKTDVTICMNMFPYVFDDKRLEYLIKEINSDLFITRITCNDERLIINSFSEDLGRDYSAIYRTVPEYFEALHVVYPIIEVFRAYPDEIESKYNSKQYFFICKR